MTDCPKVPPVHARCTLRFYMEPRSPPVGGARARRSPFSKRAIRATLRRVPWVHAFLRGNKVLARVDEGGKFAVDGGRVEIRYKPNDGRKYGARADNLTVVSGQILPEETCAPAT